MSTINSAGRPAYIYNESTDTWHQIAGKADTSSSYTWSGTHNFEASTTFDLALKARGGINNFENPTARSSAIPSPSLGIISFIKFNSAGAQVNDLQYYNGTSWTSVTDPVYDFNQQIGSYTLVISDSFKMVEMSGGGSLTVPPSSSVDFEIGTGIDILQTGSSQVTLVPGSGVTINSTPGLKLRTQWSSVTLVKRAADTWVAIGDLSA